MLNRAVWRRSASVAVGTVLVALTSLIILLLSEMPIAYAQCGGPIRSGSSLSSSLSRGGSCSYTFDGARGNLVTIKMIRSSLTLDPYLELFGSSGLISSDDDSGGDNNSLINNFPLPETGRFTIRARSYDSTGFGNFNLQFNMTSGASCGGQIQDFNKWKNDQRISAPGQTCRYTFDGVEGRTVSIAMAKQSGSSLDAYLDLVDPSGYVAISDDDSYGGSDALIDSYRLRQTGRYTIIARTYNNASAGTFSIFLQY